MPWGLSRGPEGTRVWRREVVASVWEQLAPFYRVGGWGSEGCFKTQENLLFLPGSPALTLGRSQCWDQQVSSAP